MSGRSITVVVGAIVVGAAVFIGVRQAEKKNHPITQWGEPDLAGVWKSEAPGAEPARDPFNLTALEALYKPEARTRMQAKSAKDDPTLQCIPPAFPRAAMLGRQLQIVQRPGFAYIFTEAYPVVRIVPTTGKHTAEEFLFPNYLGDPAGRWEGDTLVVDVISFNGEEWLAGGQDKPTAGSTGVWSTSTEMHVVERWRRVNADTLEFQATVEDPQMLTMPWQTPAITFKRQPVDRIEEALCRPEDGPETYLTRLGS